jgi:zinc metalloprotease ZmpA
LVNKAGTTYKLKDKTRGKHYVVSMNNGTTVETLYKDSNNVWGNGLKTNSETAAADAAYGQNMTWDYFTNIHGRNGIANDGKGARSRVHYSSNYDNAFWSDSCFCMTYGDGNFFNPLVSIDVAGHEMAHGVTSRTAKLIYSGESGGLNEGTSDIFGTMTEFYANNANDVPDYDIGEEIYKTAGQALRYMNKPNRDGASSDCWYSGVGNLDVHYSSGVANHFFYLLAEGTNPGGGLPTSPTCVAGNTKNATGTGFLAGIGRAKAEKIWYRALTVYMTQSTTFAQARANTISASDDLYGAGSAESLAVAAAWTAVNRP